MKMKHITSRMTAIILIIVIFAGFSQAQAGAAFVADKEITSKGACVLDFETGIQLYGYEENQKRVPASMTKMLTVYLVYDAIKAGEIKLDTKVKISAGVSAFSDNKEYSNVHLSTDELVSIDSLLDIVIVISACAAATALGEALSGSEAAFAKRMNEKVASLGIDATFYDAFGGSPDNKISPYGMAVLSRNLLIDHPEVLNKAKKNSITFRDKEYKTTNPLLGQYPGLDGLKTGYTDPAMYCFTATAVKDGRRIISVTMGSSSGKTRGTDSEILLDYGFAVADSVIDEVLGINKPPEGGGAADTETAQFAAYFTRKLNFYILQGIAYLHSQPEENGGSRVFWFTVYEMSVLAQLGMSVILEG